MGRRKFGISLVLFAILVSYVLSNVQFASIREARAHSAQSSDITYNSYAGDQDFTGFVYNINLWNLTYARDKKNDTYTKMNYGKATGDANSYQVRSFKVPDWGADPKPITQVDFKMRYAADMNGAGETYQIEFDVGASGPYVLVPATGVAHTLSTEVWTRTTNPATGSAWTWIDVDDIKLRVSASKQAGGSADSYFYEYEAWVSVVFPEPATNIYVSPSSIVDYAKTAGTSFSVNVSVDNAVRLWGFQFEVNYNPYLITPTGNTSYIPFTTPFPMTAKPLEGWFFIAYTMPFAEPVGFWGDGPLVKIDFSVQALGQSDLDLHNSELSDIYGGITLHTSADGYFRNVDAAKIPTASFIYTPTQPIEQEVITFDASPSTPDGASLLNYTWYFGDETSPVTTIHPTTTTTHSYSPPPTTQPLPPNNYTVVLRVFDTEGIVGFTRDIVTVFSHDIATVWIKCVPTEIYAGTVAINVTVENQGHFTESFSVTTYRNSTTIDTLPVNDLAAGTYTIVEFSWDVTGVLASTYEISANTSVISGETDTADNDFTNGYVVVSATATHELNILSVTASPNMLTIGGNVSINVNVMNEGNIAETFNVTIYRNSTLIEKLVDVTLDPLETKTLTYTWDTTGVAEGKYLIKANATILPGETNPFDNAKDDGYVRLSAHDLAVINVSASHTEVSAGQPVSINVTVQNQGIVAETNFNVTVYYNTNLIEKQTVASLSPKTSQNLTFNWDTTDVDPGVYTLRANASILAGEAETLDNEYVDGQVKLLGHDIAVTDIVASPTLVTQGESVSIDVTIKNEGTLPETFDVTVKYDESVIETRTSVSLDAGDFTILNFVWDTTGVTAGSHTITAVAGPVSGETDTADNTRQFDFVTVRVYPSASFTYTSPVLVGQTVTFNASASEAYDATINGYEWDFGDGTTKNYGIANLTDITTHTYTTIGTYTVSLTVIDNHGQSSKTTQDVIVLTHDIAIISVILSPTEATAGTLININVTVTNEGNFTETFDVTVKYDGSVIETRTGVSLDAGASTILTFTWNTTDLDSGTYLIQASASLTGELDPQDNTRVGDKITLSVPSKPGGIPDIFLYAAVGGGIIIVAALAAFYFLRVRKPKET